MNKLTNVTRQDIKPEKITKPIQLLGAWLVGLFSVNSTFLLAAVYITEPDWLVALLVVAAIVNVPIFLIAVFILQTKFRAELQEDSYYAQYISQRTNQLIKVSSSPHTIQELLSKVEMLETKLAKAVDSNGSNEPPQFNELLFGINLHFKDRNTIKTVLSEYGVLRVTTFGDPDNEPEKRVMAISQYLSNDKVKQLIELASRLQMDGYGLFDNRIEQTEEDVLIGSYGGSQFEITSKNS